MKHRYAFWILALVLALALTVLSQGSPSTGGMARGNLEMQSVGALTFAPEGTLFLGDSHARSVIAVELEDDKGEPRALNLEGLDRKVASLLGTTRERVRIHDLAISPISHAAYLTVSRGETSSGSSIKGMLRSGRTPHLIRVSGGGEITEVDLENQRFSRAEMKDSRPEGTTRRGHDARSWNIMEMAFVDDTLYVSGMSNEEWSSKLRRIPYPFGSGAKKSNGLRIFHTAHGRYETDAPARVFAPYEQGGERRIFAGFSCTPLVDFSIAEMDESEKVRGQTIAELGAGNHVLDMITVVRKGKTHFLLANHLHPFMVLDLEDFAGAPDLTRPTRRAGIDRTPLSAKGVIRLANLDPEHVAMLQESEDDRVDLVTVAVEDLLAGRG